MNTVKTTFLLTLLTVLFVFVGNALGGEGGMMFAFLFAIAMNFGAYFFSDKIVLKMYKAQELQRSDNPQLFSMMEEMTMKANLPMPKLYLIPSEQPNAFATGRDPQHSAVAVTEGIMKTLSKEELKGVLGHELAHILHRDILIGTIAATVAGAISMLANMAQWAMIFGGGRRDDREEGSPFGGILMLILAPIAAMLIQMAISRSREFLADEGGARLSGNPRFLSGALRKLDTKSKMIPMDATPATAHMFIVSPLAGLGGITNLFSTHPPMEERVARLEAMTV
ncbi:MAG: zinc metalloprotease HtpX [Ignavibacteriales bacterium]|nr:zinc metalloprotease HtpX [Ignavibacteriales bacterium]